MKLQENQIKERLKKPTNNGEVKIGRWYESRLRIFTEPKFKDELEKEEAWEDFTKFLAVTISGDKALRICDYLQYPLTVCSIPKPLLSDLYKVFNAGNSFFNVQSVKKNGGEKLQQTLANINLNTWIEKHGKRVLKNKPNTVVVVDKDDQGEPYLLAVDNDRVIDFKFKDCYVEFEYIVFTHSKEVNEQGEEVVRVAYYDEFVYSVFIKDGEEYKLEKMVEHGLGRCPARMFLGDRLNSNLEYSRESPLVLVLSKMQEWQLFDLFKFYTDHYAPFPVTEMVKAKCGIENCVNGIVHEESVYYEGNEKKMRTITRECKSCNSNNQIGVGAKILLDPQGDKDEPTASGKFRMISNDITNLEYLEKKLEKIEGYVQLKVVGEDKLLSKEAVNEKQVKGSFESKTNVLLTLKSNLDELYTWIAETVARLTIGDKPVSVTANFGTEWYLVSEEVMLERYKTARDGGLPLEEVDMLYQQYIETKYKGNPKKIARLKILNKVNPVPHKLTAQRLEMYKNGIITQKDLIISEKLVYFANIFEQKNGRLIEFGENLSELEQAVKISNIIKNYADEYIKETSTEPNGGS